jgi:hypothetical protein
VVRQTLTTDRLTLRPSRETILSMCFNAGRPSFTLSMALRDANELSSRLHARLGIRLVSCVLKTIKFICYSIESSLKLRFPLRRGRSQPWKALEEVQSGLPDFISPHPTPPLSYERFGKNMDRPIEYLSREVHLRYFPSGPKGCQP